ncbi:hypothetical protein SAMN05192544_102596 [Paraburkholderia hospita]|nr:hypothetical protein SAMN05192544_102596 [Paraburkholderia hospita]
MRTPHYHPRSPNVGTSRKRSGALIRLRGEIEHALLRAVPKTLCRAVLEIYTGSGEGVLFQLGAQHYAWVNLFANATTRSPYRALVTTARKVRIQNSKDCVLCANADDVVAALLAEIRRLQQAGAI